MLEAVRQKGLALTPFGSYRQEVMVEAVEQKGTSLQLVGPEIIFEAASEHEAEGIVVEVVKQSEVAPHHAAPLEAVRQDGYAFDHATPEHKVESIVLEIVEQNETQDALRDTAPEYEARQETVLDAVKQNGDLLQHAALEYEARQGIVVGAVKQKVNSLPIYCTRPQGVS